MMLVLSDDGVRARMIAGYDAYFLLLLQCLRHAGLAESLDFF